MAPSDAVRAAWALFLGLNQRVPRATALWAHLCVLPALTLLKGSLLGSFAAVGG